MLPEITEKISKKDIQLLASKVLDSIFLNGNIIQLAEQLSKMEFLIKEIKKDENYRMYIVNEISKYGKSYTTSSGTKIELAEVGIDFDYSLTGDNEIIELQEQKAIIDAQIKEREKFLKSITKPTRVLFDDEVKTLYPPAKTSTSGVKITISK